MLIQIKFLSKINLDKKTFVCKNVAQFLFPYWSISQDTFNMSTVLMFIFTISSLAFLYSIFFLIENRLNLDLRFGIQNTISQWHSIRIWEQSI